MDVRRLLGPYVATTTVNNITPRTEVLWYARTPVAEIIAGLRAIVPLVVFLFIVLGLVLREKLSGAGIVFYGLTLAPVGHDRVQPRPVLWPCQAGRPVGRTGGGCIRRRGYCRRFAHLFDGGGSRHRLLFAWALGFGATLAEPALNALGMTVENLTNGAFRKRTLMLAARKAGARGRQGCAAMIDAANVTLGGKLLTAIMPKGRGVAIVKALHEEKGVNTGSIASGRSLGMVQSDTYGTWVEVDVLRVVVEAGRADEVFDFIHGRAGIGDAGGGTLLQSAVTQQTRFDLPEMQEEA